MDNKNASGIVVEAYANLLHVQFEGNVRQGELADVKVKDQSLKAEVIEISGNIAKIQVFEDTRGVKRHTPVEFKGDLLEAELGPGLLTTIFDGLQNPLEEVAQKAGMYLTRGVYASPLDRKQLYDFTPVAKEGDKLTRGDTLGTVAEGRFTHHIMVPFSFYGTVTLKSVTKQGSYNIDTVVATGVDEDGKPLEFTMVQRWPVKSPLRLGTKIKPTQMMETGLRIIDTQFPMLQGGTFCTPGPFGAGKTVMQHHLSKYSSVDIVVIVACGERAGEVVEVIQTFPGLDDPQIKGAKLWGRTVMICNTSSMPVAAREASVYMGVTIAEYYRQMGLNILLLADSTSRWAQAMREMSGRLEEIPGEEAFPAYLASRIAAFYERSGLIELKSGKTGSLTIGGAVSPAGGDFSEPVTQASLAVVGAFYGLSRARADARRYPAIDPLISWTKYLEVVGRELDERYPDPKKKHWSSKVAKAMQMLRDSDEIGKRKEVVGEEGIAMDDWVVYLKGDLYEVSYLQQNAFDNEDSHTPLKRQIEMFNLIQLIFNTHFEFETHEAARVYFRDLRNALKDLNSLPFHHEKYNEALAEINQTIGRKQHA